MTACDSYPRRPDAADRVALEAMASAMAMARPRPALGWVRAVTSSVVHVAMSGIPVGAICRIGQGAQAVMAEVIGTTDRTAILSPHGGTAGLAGGQLVAMVDSCQRVAVGDALLGRVLDGFGRATVCDRCLAASPRRRARPADPAPDHSTPTHRTARH